MIRKPERSEAAPYYFTYIDKVPGDDIVPVLKIQLDDTLALCSKIPEDRSLYRYASDKWSIRQVLSHIADTERVISLRAFWFARGFDSALPSFDQLIAVTGADADRLSWGSHVEEFRRVRLATISLFENMPADAWTRAGIASDNRFTVRALAYVIAGHLVHHVGLLHERYGLAEY